MIIRFERLILLISFFFICVSSFSQERCGTVEYAKKFSPEDRQFENWLEQKIIRKRPGSNERQMAGPYKVPVVFHIIHNGEPLGTGANIPDAQIISQLKVLNKDFNRLNTDAANTPAQFASVAGSMNIEFVLAKQTPEGLTTTGIVRLNGNKSGWSSNDNYQLKSKSYWSSEQYLNIWVCNLTDFLGYTQFPTSTLLDGLEQGSDNAATDGIVISHEALGSSDDGAFELDGVYDKGRTLTHEMGHFFGLRHIWGDDSGTCSGTDYVTDTPNQAANTGGCPTHPKSDICVAAKMFQNYLDYTDDGCMNLFTQGQVDRMITVIENSPRRVSLLTSPGLQDPVPVPNDLGVREILSPLETSCSNTTPVQAEVRNYGSNQVTSATIALKVNGLTVETKPVTLNLNNLESATVAFNPTSIPTGSSTLNIEILQVNGTTDGKLQNNAMTSTVFVPQTATAPFSENMSAIPPNWTIQNPDNLVTWAIETAPKDSPSNKSLYLNFFDYEDNYGEVDVFLSPVFDLSSATASSLIFEVAYAQFSSRNDRLKVIVLTDCEALIDGTIVYDKAGATLASTTSTSQSFKPTSENQWRREILNISQFIGQSHVQLAFVGINDWGNNLYLDDITVSTSILEDIVLKEIKSPTLVTCDDQPAPRFTVQNFGTVTIDNFKVVYIVNNGAAQTFTATDLNLISGNEMELVLPPVALQEGTNTLVLNITEPNGNVDEIPSDNQKQFTIVVNKAEDRIPMRENFEETFEDRWTTVNSSGVGMVWQSTSTNEGISIYFNAFDNTVIEDEAWLVSPVLDFSGAVKASMVVDVSYATRAQRIDDLKVMASSDCGNTYTEVAKIPLTGTGVESSNTSWVPQAEAGWRKNKLVNLNAYAGSEQVRIAFVATNDNGNNIFLDNIEFFVTDTPSTIDIADSHAIYQYDETSPKKSEIVITFNLPTRQNVRYSVVDMMGRSHGDGVLADVLNQTYPLELRESLSSGIYIIRLQMEGRYYADKVLIVR